MSISPLITFKAGICDFDVSRDLPILFLRLRINKILKTFRWVSDNRFRPAHLLPK